MYKNRAETIMTDMDFKYARKSTEDKNRQVASIPDQLSITDKLGINHNANVLKDNVITDEKTGMKPGKRVGFKRMMDKIFDSVNKGGVCRIFCWKACRLARNSTEGGMIVDLVRDGKLKIITQESGYFDETNFFMLHMEFGYNSKFSKDISVGVKRNNNYKIEKGIYPGRPHLGYKFNPDVLKGLKDHIPNPRNFDKCKEWIDLMLSGDYTVEESLAIMTARGLVGNDGEPVSKSRAYVFFRDIFNVGFFELKSGPNKGIHKGIHKPLLKMSEYKKIQQIIDGRSSKQNRDNPLPLQGIIKCESCNATITGEKHLKKYKNGKEQLFCHYRCSKKLGPCDEKYVNTDNMDGQVKTYVEDIHIDKKCIDLLKKIFARNMKLKFQQISKNKELKTKLLEDIAKEKKILYGMKDDGLYSEEDYQKEKAKLLKKEQEIKEDTIADEGQYWNRLLEDAMEFVIRVQNLYDIDDAFIKQQIVKILGSNLLLGGKTLKIEAKSTFVGLKIAQKNLTPENEWFEPRHSLVEQAKYIKFDPALLYSTAYGS